MDDSLILSIVSLIVSSIIFWVIFIRDSNKSFHDNLYKAKQSSYISITTKILEYLDKSYELLEFSQDFTGNEEHWNLEIQKKSHRFYEIASELRREGYKHVMILPSKSLVKFNEISLLAIGHITNHYHYRNDAAADSFNKLYDLANEFIELGRVDLRIDKLDRMLNNRIGKTFYPLGLKDKINNIS